MTSLFPLGYSALLVTIHGCFPSFSNLPPPVVHNECLQNGRSSCLPGYVCGKYGCARERKAFGVGVKSLKELAASDEENLMPVRRITNTKNVAAMFFQCCEDNLLPDGCLEQCSFAAYNRKTIMSMVLRVGSCPVQALPALHYCASRSNDHRPCCARRHLPEHCLIFCGPPFDQSVVNVQHMICMEHLESMKACFYEDFRKEHSVRPQKLNAGRSRSS